LTRAASRHSPSTFSWITYRKESGSGGSPDQMFLGSFVVAAQPASSVTRMVTSSALFMKGLLFMRSSAPFFKLTSGAGNITDDIRAGLVELRLHDRSGAYADALELELTDDGSLAWPRAGAEINIVFGYPDSRRKRQ